MNTLVEIDVVVLLAVPIIVSKRNSKINTPTNFFVIRTGYTTQIWRDEI